MGIARHTSNGEPECDVTIVHLCGSEEMVPGQLQAPTSQVALAQVLSTDIKIRHKGLFVYFSVANPECLSRIPDPTFFHPGSRIRTVSIPDPHQRI